MYIIGISGKAGSGKSTAAKIIQKNLVNHYRIYHFADPIREGLKAMFGWTNLEFRPERKNIPATINGQLEVSPRQAMQTLGTEWGRNCIDSRLWEKLVPRRQKLIIPDVRFPNEAKFCLDNGILIYINRPGLPLMEHESESHLDTIRKQANILIINDGSYEEFRDTVKASIPRILFHLNDTKRLIKPL